MSIAIVSASPQTTPAAAIDLVTATGENPLAGSDFASLLLGQLFADNTTTPRNDIAETSATEAANSESIPEATVANVSSAELVVPSQLPVEQRSGFASLLLGQLFADNTTTPRNDIAETSATEAADTESVPEATVADSPAALLVVLSQLPVEPRNATPPVASPSVTDAPELAGPSLAAFKGSAVQEMPGETQAHVPPHANAGGATLENRRTQETADRSAMPEIASPMPPANTPGAAKFAAAPSFILPDEKSPAATTQVTEAALPGGGETTAPAAPGWTSVVHRTEGTSEMSLNIPAGLRDKEWNNEFAQKVVWLATRNTQAAEITLNPPHLGAIEISLRLDHDTATASFASGNADVRERIETALPRLREMFASVGIELGQANVSAESFRHGGSPGQSAHEATPARSDGAILAVGRQATPIAATMVVGHGQRLVDIFA